MRAKKTINNKKIPQEAVGKVSQASGGLNEAFHFKRDRINKLFMEAAQHPLVLVCAGAGYGKTSAVHDFVKEYNSTTVWIQLSERDNVGARFWENCLNTLAKLNLPLSKAAAKLGFPDSMDKIKLFMSIVNEHIVMKPRIIVLDDFHYIQDHAVLRFMEESVLYKMPPGTSVFLLSRTSPQLNIASLLSKGYIYNINENDLRFTENELAQYFLEQKIAFQHGNLREIMQDTEGWVFAINLISHSYQRAPGYSGYVRNAMKINIFKLMETEIWDRISNNLQQFLTRLSLIEHLSVELITLLAGEEKSLITELEKQSAYIRRDNYINAYLIHRLLLEFLSTKQEMLTEKQKRETYAAAGAWCNENGFKIDALTYYEKIGGYESIVSILKSYPFQIPYGIAKYSAGILDRAPQETFKTVALFATMHVFSYFCHGLWEDSVELAKQYEDKLLKLPDSNPIKNYALGSLYYWWGCLRLLMCTVDHKYDFCQYLEKSSKYSSNHVDLNRVYNHNPGPWILAVGSSGKESVQEFFDSYTRANVIISRLCNGLKTGEDEILKGELDYYKDNLQSAETNFICALEYSKQSKLYEIIHRCLFYILRLSIVQGNYLKAEQALKEMKNQFDESIYINRYINYDISRCWYFCILGLPEKVPDWLKKNFSPYSHAASTENFANQMKALYCYATRNYPPLLSYISELKQRESFLLGRIEMLALEACIHYKMKDTKKALSSLLEAYKTASPNEFVMPFIELGKDMRTLTSFVMKKKESGIPKVWLETINRRSASYAKRLAHVISEYKMANSITDVSISPREAEVLKDLSHGLSRTEIAANRNLTINTIKMIIKNLYMKLGAQSIADAIRIAAEKKIL